MCKPKNLDLEHNKSTSLDMSVRGRCVKVVSTQNESTGAGGSKFRFLVS